MSVYCTGEVAEAGAVVLEMMMIGMTGPQGGTLAAAMMTGKTGQVVGSETTAKNVDMEVNIFIPIPLKSLVMTLPQDSRIWFNTSKQDKIQMDINVSENA